MNDLALFCYTHSDYSDCWPLFFGQTDQYLVNFKKYVFVDHLDSRIPEEYQQIIYNEKDIYRLRLASCLKQITEPYCFLHHEDMFLYKTPDYNLLLNYFNILKTEEVDFIKLLKGGEARDICFKDSKSLKIIPQDSKWIFAIQPSFWKTSSLLQVYQEVPGKTIWEFEVNAQEYCRQKKIKGLYHYQGEQKRGQLHWDSGAYPYIATAIFKGKWVLNEYPELRELLKRYNIDPNKRGWI